MIDKQQLEIITEIANGNLGGARKLGEKYFPERYRLQVEKIISEDFEEYEHKMLSLSKEEIFRKAYEINAIKEIAGFFADTDYLTDEQYKILIKIDSEINGSLIGVLLNYFFDNEYASVNSYEDILQWIGWFCDEEKEREFND